MAALASLPEWRQFTQERRSIHREDVDSIFSHRTSLIDASGDAVAIPYSARDEAVDRAIIALTSQRTGEDRATRRSTSRPSVKGWRFAFLLRHEPGVPDAFNARTNAASYVADRIAGEVEARQHCRGSPRCW